MRKIVLLVFAIGLSLAGCATAPAAVEVTRIVPATVEVTRIVDSAPTIEHELQLLLDSGLCEEAWHEFGKYVTNADGSPQQKQSVIQTFEQFKATVALQATFRDLGIDVSDIYWDYDKLIERFESYQIAVHNVGNETHGLTLEQRKLRTAIDDTDTALRQKSVTELLIVAYEASLAGNTLFEQRYLDEAEALWLLIEAQDAYVGGHAALFGKGGIGHATPPSDRGSVR